MATDAMLPAWRLLHHFDQPGARQMAIDEALLTTFASAGSLPVLKVSSWRPACLSVGYGQSLDEVDLTACAGAGIDVVRRPSGGRAVLHAHELTYAVVTATDDPIAGGTIAQTYRVLSAGVLAGVQALGVRATLARGQAQGNAASRRSGACFASATRHEVLWQERKLVGSAQVRRDGVLLQHGSVRLMPPAIDLATLLRTDATARPIPPLAHTATTVLEATGRGFAPAEAATLFADAFAGALGVRLEGSRLTDDEAAAADRLERCRYAEPTWSLRRPP